MERSCSRMPSRGRRVGGQGGDDSRGGEDVVRKRRLPCLDWRALAWVALLMAAFIAGSAQAATITVAQGESIQAAVDGAGVGDTVVVNGGVYEENLVIDRAVVLVGNGTTGPVVDAGGKGSAVTITADGVSLSGFTVTGSGPGDDDAGIRVAAQGVALRDNVIHGNSVGIFLQGAENVLVRGNVAEENQVGLYLETSHGNVIVSNRINDNDVGIHVTRINNSQSVTPSDVTAGDGEGVSIVYKPSAAVFSYNVSEMGFPGASMENLFYENELLENGQSAFDDGENAWDKEGRGNRYGDFDALDEGCRDRDRDGICDSSRPVPGGSSVDGYPMATEDAIFSYKAVSGPYRLSIYRSTFQPSGEISLSYRVSENFSGWAALMPSEVRPQKAAAEVALSSGTVGGVVGTLSFTAPAEEGSYDLRLYDGSGGELVSLPIEVRVPALAASKASLGTCDSIGVNYSGAPGLDEDWIGLYSLGARDENAISRQYLGGEGEGTLNFYAPSAPGSYEFRMFEDDGYHLLATSGSFDVSASSGVRIKASPSRVSPGGLVEVFFWGAKAQSAVGMYGVTTPDKFMLAMQYVNGRPCGTLTFRAPTAPGSYEFRLFENNVYRKHMGASNVILVG